MEAAAEPPQGSSKPITDKPSSTSELYERFNDLAQKFRKASFDNKANTQKSRVSFKKQSPDINRPKNCTENGNCACLSADVQAGTIGDGEDTHRLQQMSKTHRSHAEEGQTSGQTRKQRLNPNMMKSFRRNPFENDVDVQQGSRSFTLGYKQTPHNGFHEGRHGTSSTGKSKRHVEPSGKGTAGKHKYRSKKMSHSFCEPTSHARMMNEHIYSHGHCCFCEVHHHYNASNRRTGSKKGQNAFYAKEGREKDSDRFYRVLRPAYKSSQKAGGTRKGMGAEAKNVLKDVIDQRLAELQKWHSMVSKGHSTVRRLDELRKASKNLLQQLKIEYRNLCKSHASGLEDMSFIKAEIEELENLTAEWSRMLECISQMNNQIVEMEQELESMQKCQASAEMCNEDHAKEIEQIRGSLTELENGLKNARAVLRAGMETDASTESARKSLEEVSGGILDNVNELKQSHTARTEATAKEIADKFIAKVEKHAEEHREEIVNHMTELFKNQLLPDLRRSVDKKSMESVAEFQRSIQSFSIPGLMPKRREYTPGPGDETEGMNPGMEQKSEVRSEGFRTSNEPEFEH